MKRLLKTILCTGFSLVFIILPCGGCEEQMKWSPIYGATLCGALIGGIIGHQSDETEAGIEVGAAIFGVGALLSEIDSASKPKNTDNADDQVRYSPVSETYVIDVHNSNGTITPVEIKKKGETYIGPKNEQYKELPSEEQLRPTYGTK